MEKYPFASGYLVPAALSELPDPRVDAAAFLLQINLLVRFSFEK
jgi:hypothetical protein